MQLSQRSIKSATFYSGKTDWAVMGSAATGYVWFDTKLAYSDAATLSGSRYKKSIYDPCPKRRKLPIDGTWSDFIQSETANSSDRGLNFAQGIYYWPKVT